MSATFVVVAAVVLIFVFCAKETKLSWNYISSSRIQPFGLWDFERKLRLALNLEIVVVRWATWVLCKPFFAFFYTREVSRLSVWEGLSEHPLPVFNTRGRRMPLMLSYFPNLHWCSPQLSLGPTKGAAAIAANRHQTNGLHSICWQCTIFFGAFPKCQFIRAQGRPRPKREAL